MWRLKTIGARDLSFLNYAYLRDRLQYWLLFAIHLDNIVYFVLLRHVFCVENAGRYRNIGTRVDALLKGDDFSIEQ